MGIKREDQFLMIVGEFNTCLKTTGREGTEKETRN